MNTNFKFSDVKIKGKTISFTVKDAASYKNALQKATNYIVKKYYGGDKEAWTSQYTFLNQNIKNGYTDVSVERKQEQGELDLSFNSTFQELYSGLINEET